MASNSAAHNWRRLGGEFVVIVVGVLTALGVDQWAAARADRALEAEYITRLEADLISDSVMLADRKALAESGLAQLGDLLAEIPNQGEVDLTPYRGLPWYYFVGPAAPPRPSTSAIDELTSTGGLTLIRSAELRTVLLEYYRSTELESANQERAFERGREPFMELGWEVDVVERTDFARPQVQVDAASLDRVVRRAIAYQSILARVIADWQEQLAQVLVAMRQNYP